MSHTISINVIYHTAINYPVPEIIEMYISNGWNMNDFGHISLRALGDKDDYDWIELQLGQVDELYKVISKKVEANEDPAVVLMLNEIEVGAVTTFFPKENRINFLLMIGRKKHPELPEWTDISWYIPKLIKPLLASGIVIEQIASFDSL
jgi:hypothetical protein